MKARILTTLLLASAMLVTQMTTSLPGAALDLARPAQPMEVAIHTGRIAFASDRDENWEVYTMNADGSQPTNLSNYPLGGGYAWRSTDVNPSWSPDGKRIAFASDRHVDFHVDWDGNRDIYVMNADGSDQVNVSHHPQSDFLPSWQPQVSGDALAQVQEGMQRDGSWLRQVLGL